MITLEDALRIGKSTAGLWGTSDCMTYVEFTFSASELLTFARQVEAETIERCAKVCEELPLPGNVRVTGVEHSCAAAIRALQPIEQGRKEPKCKTCLSTEQGLRESAAALRRQAKAHRDGAHTYRDYAHTAEKEEAAAESHERLACEYASGLHHSSLCERPNCRRCGYRGQTDVFVDECPDCATPSSAKPKCSICNDYGDIEDSMGIFVRHCDCDAGTSRACHEVATPGTEKKGENP